MEWITSIELGRFLMAHPDEEFECRLRIGYGLVSTHWWYFDSEHRHFLHSRETDDSIVTQREFLEYFGNCFWRIEQ